MNPTRPVEIVGGGLAGLALGRALCAAGVSVTIDEAGDYPRHRVCGEFITGLSDRTRAALRLNPVLRGARASHTVGWFADGRLVRADNLPAAAVAFSRFELDARLAESFVESGGVLRTHSRVPLTADGPGRVFASGRRRIRSEWLGLKVHAVGFPLRHDLEVHLGRKAYVGVARIDEARVNVCGLFRRRAASAPPEELLLEYLKASGLRSLAQRLTASAPDPDSFCAVAAVGFDRTVHPTREVRIGDACAVIPPFTGHGMAMAFESAEIALQPLLAYACGEAEWPETRDSIAAGLRRRFRIRLASASLLHPFLLEPGRQRWLAWLTQARLLPLRPLYTALH